MSQNNKSNQGNRSNSSNRSSQGSRSNQGNRGNRSQQGNRGSRNNRGNNNRRNTPGHGQRYLPKGTTLYILDRLEHGGISREKHGWKPICQIMTAPNFQLFEIEYNADASIQLQGRYKIERTTEDSEQKFGRISKNLGYSDLTATSKEMMEPVVTEFIEKNSKKFIDFLNTVGPITIRRHFLELLPGVGKTLMRKILDEREREKFNSFEDVHTRVNGFNPIHSIVTRIIMELKGGEEIKHHIFIRKKSPNQSNRNSTQNRSQSGKNTHSNRNTQSSRNTPSNRGYYNRR